MTRPERRVMATILVMEKALRQVSELFWVIRLFRIHHYIRSGAGNLARDIVFFRLAIRLVGQGVLDYLTRNNMKISPKPLRRWLALPLPFCFGLAVLISCSQAADAPKDK